MNIQNSNTQMRQLSLVDVLQCANNVAWEDKGSTVMATVPVPGVSASNLLVVEEGNIIKVNGRNDTYGIVYSRIIPVPPNASIGTTGIHYQDGLLVLTMSKVPSPQSRVLLGNPNSNCGTPGCPM